ncbi:MAG: protein-methionine-sulfoxide reductase heme-binding subunit MsrQ [Gemmatimonadaceae bacterium]
MAPPLAVVVALLPALHVIWRTATGDLGADPIETLEHATGDWAIRFLIVTLAVTPLRQATGWGWLVSLRRTFGLAVFAYATVHLLIYLVLDMGLMGSEIVKDVLEHPWVTLGMTSWLLLLPLAITSTRGWVRRLGGRRWQRLHRLIYVVPFTASLHYFWAVKKDVRLPLLFAGILAMLLGVRLWRELARRRARVG